MIGAMNAVRPLAATAMMLALAACATKPAAPGGGQATADTRPEAAYVPAGVAETCEKAAGTGLAAVIRNKVACQLTSAREVNLKARNLAAEFRRVNTVPLGRRSGVGVAEDLVQRWAADPATSLAPRPDFRPVRVEDLAFKMTPALSGEAQAFDIRGRLITEDGRSFGLTGRLLMARGLLTLAALDLTPAG